MQVESWMRVAGKLVLVDIEVSLMPGLPQIHFLGLPDMMLRESALRIKSAIKQQGFAFPRAQKILVNLKPSYIKKNSRGLDLAVAAAILWESNQLRRPSGKPRLYGELSLKGEVLRPDDFAELTAEQATQLITGPGGAHHVCDLFTLNSLKELENPFCLQAMPVQKQNIRPASLFPTYSKASAEVLILMAVGEHPSLLAGAPGTGKTALARSLYSFLKASSNQTQWRSFLEPHHSSSALSLIGGHDPVRIGEIERAMGGVLLLDELLEFDRKVQEILREPLESNRVRLAKASGVRDCASNFLLLATSNLCACGQWDPDSPDACLCSQVSRKRFLQRLSIPFLDRLQLLVFSSQWQRWRGSNCKEVSARWVLEVCERTWRHQEKRRQTVNNSSLGESQLLESSAESVRDQFVNSIDLSRRRNLACLRVARSVADMHLSERIEANHWRIAHKLSVRNFFYLSSGMSLKPSVVAGLHSAKSGKSLDWI